MAKNNSKSIRLSDKVLNYIENYQGNGFNEKFENIILFSMEIEERKKNDILFLDKLIEEKRNELNELSELYRKHKEAFYQINMELSKIQRLLKQ